MGLTPVYPCPILDLGPLLPEGSTVSDAYTLLLAGVFLTSATQGERPVTARTPEVEAAEARQRSAHRAQALYVRQGGRA